MDLLRKVQNHFIPTVENAFRPRVLGRASLLFFFIFTLGVESLLIVDTAAKASDRYTANVAAIGQLLPVVNDPVSSANEILIGVASLLTIFVCLAFFIHIDIQEHRMLLGGVVVVLMALVCVAANMHLQHLV